VRTIHRRKDGAGKTRAADAEVARQRALQDGERERAGAFEAELTTAAPRRAAPGLDADCCLGLAIDRGEPSDVALK
jgi:hypothetical protein